MLHGVASFWQSSFWPLVGLRSRLYFGSGPSPRGKVETTRAVLGWAIPGWVRSWLNFLPFGLWIALALLPLLGLHQMLAGRSGGIWESMDEHDFFPHLIVAVLAVTSFSVHLPGLLHRWARPQSPPAPCPPDQADPRREGRP